MKRIQNLILHIHHFSSIIYDLKANDNEEESAEVFSQFSKEAGILVKSLSLQVHVLAKNVNHKN